MKLPNHSKRFNRFIPTTAVVVVFLAVVILCPLASRGQPVRETVLYNFGGPPDGSGPQASPVLGINNQMYGVTGSGGPASLWGTLFKINTDGSGYAIMHNFTNSPDGSTPVGALVFGNDGMLYGMTGGGGSNGVGTIFKINPNGSDYQILYNFQGAPDGNSPAAGLMLATNGAFYGATRLGGTNNLGTIFTIHGDGNGYQVLYSFTNTPDGASPQDGLMQANDGAVYGGTLNGGPGNHGTIFRIQLNGSGYQVLHTYTNTLEGSNPRGTLLQASDGLLYGATQVGGTSGSGSLFKMNLDGTGYTVLHSFTSNPDGSRPLGGLIQGSQNLLYGTTQLGGTNTGGVLYRMQMGGGGYEVVHHFGNGTDGSRPTGTLTRGASLGDSGLLYGTTTINGTGGVGVLFAAVVNPPMTITPVVNQSGASGPVVFWPAFALNYVLQTTTNVNTGPWVNVTNAVPVTGVQVTNLPDPAGAYFRLVWPQ